MNILLLLSFICYFARSIATQCNEMEYGTVCPQESSPEIIKILDDKLLVGTANFLKVLQLDLQEVQNVNVSSPIDLVDSCTRDQLGPEECKNFVSVIQPLPDTADANPMIMVCGSNSFQPKCTLHQRNMLSNFTKLTADGVRDAGYSPHRNTDSIVAVLASNGRFFSATRFEPYAPHTLIGMSPGTLQHDSTFTVLSPRSDPVWLNQPNFISIYELGDHIYFFITERAIEVNQGLSVRYSRAIRICKTDEGIGNHNVDLNHFLTYQKARMECSFQGESGSIPYFYNDLKSTFLDQSVSESPVLYGIFNSAINGPAGGAICKFSFDSDDVGSLKHVFEGETSTYLVPGNDDPDVWEQSNPVPTFGCPGTQSTQRPLEDAAKYQLLYNSITPTQEQPLFIAAGEFLDKIAAETIRYKNNTQEIIYYTNMQGDVKQVILSGIKSYNHTILQSRDQEQIEELILHRSNNSERSIYFSTNDNIVRIIRGQCSRYSDCFSCLDSRDVYCGWNGNACVNKLVNTDSLTQSFSASEVEITRVCGEREPSPPPPVITDTPSPCSRVKATTTITPTIETAESKEEGEECTSSTSVSPTKPTNPILPSDIGLKSDEESTPSISIPIIAGASTGAFILGIFLGSLVCFFFYKRLASSTPNSNKEEAPEIPGENCTDNDGELTKTQVNNQLNVTEKEQEIMKQNSTPRYIQHKPPALKPVDHTPVNDFPQTAFGSTASLPSHGHTTSKEMNHNLYQSPIDEDYDSAFSDKDTVAPLKSFPSTGVVYGSLGRNKMVGSNGITRKQVPGYKLPKGRTDSTTWLRQASVSSDISALDSPISDV